MYVNGTYTQHGISISSQTILKIGWYTHRHVKYFRWYIYRQGVLEDDLNDINNIVLKLNKRAVMQYVFPERYQKLQELHIVQTFKHMHCKMPSVIPDSIFDIDYGMILAGNCPAWYWNLYLCSPLGVKSIDHISAKNLSIENVAQELHMELPDEHTWEKMQPYWVLNAIK